MKHTQGELLDIVYRYYPRGVGIVDGDIDVQLIYASEEHARLVAARQQVATDERWPALFRRIVERFPDASLMNRALYLPTGGQDACHSFTLYLPGAADQREPARRGLVLGRPRHRLVPRRDGRTVWHPQRDHARRRLLQGAYERERRPSRSPGKRASVARGAGPR